VFAVREASIIRQVATGCYAAPPGLTNAANLRIVPRFPSIYSEETGLANTAQAKKRARQAVRHRAHNVALRSKARTHIKKVVDIIESKDKAAAQDAYRQAVKVIDAVVGKGLLHKNTAARHKSRLNTRIRALD
jgi:small subunit ribosomal protein S20